VTTSKVSHPTWLVLSAFDANALFNEVQALEYVCLYLHAAGIRGSRSYVVDDLMFFNIHTSSHDRISRSNSNLRRELGFFAGRLYLDNYDDNLTILDYIHNENQARNQSTC
jgi:hypothetical protein